MRFWYLICLAWCPNDTFTFVKNLKKLPIQLTLEDLQKEQDIFLRKHPAVAQHDWRQVTIQSVLKKEKLIQAKVKKDFQKAFQDSFTRQAYALKNSVNKFQM